MGRSEPALERAVEDGRKQRVQLGFGLHLQALQPVHLRLQGIELRDNAALLEEGWGEH